MTPLPRRLLVLALLLAPALVGCGDSCKRVSAAIGYACLPDLVAPESTVSIEVREACGTYCAREPTCNASFQGGQVFLELVQDSCGDVNPNQCATESCTQRVATCALPHLPVGDYPLVIPGSPDRLLRVRDGGQLACRIANPTP